MTQLRLFRPQVRDVLARRRRDQRDPFDDLEAVALDDLALARVVRHQAHALDTEIEKDQRADAVLAGVGGKAELEIRLDGVATLFLQRVRAQLLTEADPPAFV